MPVPRTVRVMYEETTTQVVDLPEPVGSYAELLAAVESRESPHTHVRILFWYVLPEGAPK